MNRLPNKRYFKKFVNKYDGIPEANFKDEESATVDESEDPELSERKPKKKKGADKGAQLGSGDEAESPGSGEDGDD